MTKTRAIPLLIALALAAQARPGPAYGATISSFTAGDIVVSVEGNGSSTGSYTDNQAAPLTLFEFGVNGTSSASLVGSLMLPQTASGANLPISGEYGSSSEGTLQLSGNGKYLTIAGYGVNAAAFNAAGPGQSFGQSFGGDTKTCIGGATCYPLAQTASVANTPGSAGSGVTTATVVPRVIALIGANGSVDTSTALTGVFNENNPRSVYSADGTSFYVSGQGKSGDKTSGVFYATKGSTTATTITGNDGGSGTSQDTRDVQIFNNTLYVSNDSKQGATNRDYIATLGTAGTPPTTLANSGNGPAKLPGFGNNGGTGKVTITANTTNGINSAGKEINLSPEGFFFANATTLYVADSGQPKNDSVTNDGSIGSTLGDGGLQKWSLVGGNWTLDYTLSAGLNLVANTGTVGTTGLFSITGALVTIDGVQEVQLFATNSTIGDLDPTFLYGITDVLAATTPPGGPGGETFIQLASAPDGSNFKGVAFAPQDQSVPEPASIALLATGFLGCGLLRRRERNRSRTNSNTSE